MIGAVIGDLAAWTWEHDRECFYVKLVSKDARLSGYGMLHKIRRYEKEHRIFTGLYNVRLPESFVIVLENKRK